MEFLFLKAAFFCPFHKYFFDSLHVPSTLLGAEDSMVYGVDLLSLLTELML